MDPVIVAREALPVFVVLLVCLMQLRYWQACLTYERIIRRLREDIAFLRPAPGEETS